MLIFLQDKNIAKTFEPFNTCIEKKLNFLCVQEWTAMKTSIRNFLARILNSAWKANCCKLLCNEANENAVLCTKVCHIVEILCCIQFFAFIKCLFIVHALVKGLLCPALRCFSCFRISLLPPSLVQNGRLWNSSEVNFETNLGMCETWVQSDSQMYVKS